MLLNSLSSHFIVRHTATPEIYTLSLHDALPICFRPGDSAGRCKRQRRVAIPMGQLLLFEPAGLELVVTVRKLRIGRAYGGNQDRKSTRLNSSHLGISYAVFCLKKKKNHITKHVT